MDNNLYLNFIYKLIKSNQITEEKKIFNLYNDNIVSKKLINTQLIKVKKVIVKIKLENSKILLIEDVPLNFLLCYSIFVGRETNLFEFELKENQNTKYICNKKIYDLIKDKINLKSVKGITSQEIDNLKFEFCFEEPQIIKEIRNYIKDKKKINFNKIRIVKNEKIELFLPTVKNRHFKLAREMNVPIIALVKKNYIKDSNINVLDEKSQINLVNPFFEFKENVLWNLYDNKKTIRAVRDEIFLKVNKSYIENKLDNIENINVDKEEILTDIENLGRYRISSEKEEIVLPLWKSHELQRFVEIKDEENFRELSGVEFRLDNDYLKKIYIQSINGEKANYMKKYAEEKILKIVEKYSNQKNIRFRNVYELVIALTLNDNIESIGKFDKNIEEKTKELIKIIRYVTEVTIKKSIEFNKIPKKEESEKFLDEYYLSVASHLNLELKKFKDKNNKNEFLRNVLKISNNLILTIKSNDVEFSNLFYFAQISIVLIKILENYDRDVSKKIEELFKSYFKENQFLTQNSKVNDNVENLINSITFLKRVSQKQRTYIILKKKIDEKLIPGNVKLMKNPTIEKSIVKPKVFTLKKVFPYSYKEISEKIKKFNNVKDIDGKEIEIKGRKIKLKKEFFLIYNEYKTYRQIFENEFFKILVVKSSN